MWMLLHEIVTGYQRSALSVHRLLLLGAPRKACPMGMQANSTFLCNIA